jgi:hypothetical protein
VHDGLAPRISDVSEYVFFSDAVRGIKRPYKVVNWTKFNARKKRDPDANVRDFTEVFYLNFERLPGYENLSQREYSNVMHQKLEEERLKIVQDRKERGLGFASAEDRRKVVPGARPRRTKTSTREDHRPRVISVCS